MGRISPFVFELDADAFRIKIWYEENDLEVVVYDNQMDETEDSDAATEIGGGSIVIHGTP